MAKKYLRRAQKRLEARRKIHEEILRRNASNKYRDGWKQPGSMKHY